MAFEINEATLDFMGQQLGGVPFFITGIESRGRREASSCILFRHQLLKNQCPSVLVMSSH